MPLYDQVRRSSNAIFTHLGHFYASRKNRSLRQHAHLRVGCGMRGKTESQGRSCRFK
jgi:hypothetical protein